MCGNESSLISSCVLKIFSFRISEPEEKVMKLSYYLGQKLYDVLDRIHGTVCFLQGKFYPFALEKFKNTVEVYLCAHCSKSRQSVPRNCESVHTLGKCEVVVSSR